ncbi:SRPBCC domain-containing protein [Nibribacter koreensis]|uniref:Activator of Hsp90 ATPase homologue 1/2-like C-terminal domain-containing protein n=1 Tax=Nibribacter koreensis TaxID=1084519 RepID=A0ABP8FCM9_9BACT
MAQHTDFIYTHELPAPLSKVWDAWTNEENLGQWWGPSGYDLGVKEFNLQPEGFFHYSMSANGGPKMWGKFVFKEIQPTSRLVFVNSFSDEEGNLLRAPFSATWPIEMLNEVTFEEKDGNTLMTLAGRPHNATHAEEQTYADGHASMQQGFAGTFKKLEEFLK